ncbi:hypothetical protein VDGL01_08849 [Verticillium dahliae]
MVALILGYVRQVLVEIVAGDLKCPWTRSSQRTSFDDPAASGHAGNPALLPGQGCGPQ